MQRKQKTLDGNQAAAHVSYAYSDVAAVYPITPSSTMAEVTDEWAAEGRENIFGHTVQVTEMQSEAGVAGAVHGALTAGALTTTFTASQGLLLMIPNLYKIAGEQLPGVFNVAARTVATHALSIFGDHSDIYACRQTGVAMLASGSVQEVMDLTPVAHLAALKGRLPFLNFFDGFRTSHELQKVDIWDYEDLKELMDFDALRAFRARSLNPNRAKLMGSAQNPDIFFQAREACNGYYDALPGIVESCMRQINQKIGASYGLFDYYGAEDAAHVIIAMGSVCETICETIDCLNARGGKNGLVKVHLYRPFSVSHLLAVLPGTVKQITVLNRTKEPGSVGDPLYLDVTAALRHTAFHDTPVFSGRYGLSSKDTTPSQIAAAFHNTVKMQFTLGITDDVTHLSLPVPEYRDTLPQGTVSCKFWGLGGDGTVSANKNAIKIIGNHTSLHVQAYFDYDSKKSGGLTVSHLRFGEHPIRSAYLIRRADFVACHNPTYVSKYNMAQELKDGGTFLLNCRWEEKDLEQQLPGQLKRYLAEHNISFYIIDALKIGKEIGLNNKISTILQAAFFRLADLIPIETAEDLMKKAAEISYRKKGDHIVEMNFAAIERGIHDVRQVQIPPSWKEAEEEPLYADLLCDRPEVERFVQHIQKPVTAQEGNMLPVSAFLPYVDGSTPSGSAAHERRNVATEIPVWKPENCIQCNRCAYVCPHAVIRPAVMAQEEQNTAPAGMSSLPMTGMPEYAFAVTVSQVDCTGCGSCAGVCPGRQGRKALEMCPVTEHAERQQYFDYGKALSPKPAVFDKFPLNTVKGSQFKRPLLEFSGACAGCGETPYTKLVTQLFGERMYIANATGCSSIWGNSSPSAPYAANSAGEGPAWANSLFEDAAEFGYGMLLAQTAIRSRLRGMLEAMLSQKPSGALETAIAKWLSTFGDATANIVPTRQLIAALMQHNTPSAQAVLAEQEYLAKKSQWIFGGDGWAYDIGFGGLDHVIASGQNINILVLDTEVYSNTGGQASKATPMGSTAKFSAGGKSLKKKDLAGMAMSYGYVYVAQIAMGADYNQTLKALMEAEGYDGPSLVIAYAPCISHGIRAGMGSSQAEQAKAVEAGYWNLFRFHPDLENPFCLDSKAPSLDYGQFLSGEIRYDALQKMHPDKAQLLFEEAKEDAARRYERLRRLPVLYAKTEAGPSGRC